MRRLISTTRRSVVGFAVLMAVLGWHPTDKRGKSLSSSCTAEYTQSRECFRIAG